MKNKKSWLIVGLIALLVTASSLVSIYTDWLWFDSVGYLSVFSKSIFYQIGVFLFGAVVVFSVIYVNLRFSKRYLGKDEMDSFLVIGALIFAFLIGLGISGNWQNILLYLNKTSFGVSDPVFGMDISFYVFSLPVFSLIKDLLMIAVVLAIIFVFTKFGLSFKNIETIEDIMGVLPDSLIKHLSVLAAAFFGLLAIHFYLDRFSVLYSERGFVYGAGYTDVNVLLPAITILVVLSIIAALVSVYNVKNKSFRIFSILVILILAVSFLGGSLVPGLVQSFQVNPSELSLEEQYIEDNIEFTRQGFNLDEIDQREFNATTNLTREEIDENPKTIENIRLWDYRALQTTYEQIQEIRTYYSFNDVDVDRYTLNESDGYRQVMLSVREMDTDNLPEQADTWVNNHLVYTHGYGAVMSPVNEKTSEGAPRLLVQDIPPRGPIDLTRPEVYYGTGDYSYVVTDTNRQEFDYPSGEQNFYTNYQGSGGVELSALRELAYSYHFGSINLFLTQYVNEDSQVMYHRNVRDRVETIAPFLEYDNDPYAVLEEGRIHWVIDAYTTSDRYPYSEPKDGINYIRNSVKVVVDAYSGEVDFYVADESDPIINAWSNVFPNLFNDLDEMPDSLKDHIRYPEDYFSIQMEKYTEYHMQDPTVFYNQEDLWEIPNEKYSGDRRPVEPYYVSISLPERNETEFMLMQPFTPSNRDNMIAWIGARSDVPNYGELLHYQFSKGELIYGPSQIEARIDQDPTISQQLTLWDQQGSNVIRGNLLVIPLEESLLYVEPIFIQSDEGSIPELRRVLVSNGDNVVMAETLDQGIDRLVGEGVDDGGIGDIEGNIQEALENYYAAIEAQRQGDWESYGNYLNQLEGILESLNQTVPSPDSGQ